jgi:excisionase family DNA binding protein
MHTILERAIAPTEEDQRLASESSRALERLNPPANLIGLRVASPDRIGETYGSRNREDVLSIPEPAFRLLLQILKEMAAGNAVTVIPVSTMLTTQQAADILNVSRPFLVGLLESGKIPFRRLGSHRRMRLMDLVSFQQEADAAADKALRAMADEAQDLGLGY